MISGGYGGYAGNNFFATSEPGEAICGYYSGYYGYGSTVWFKWTAPANGTVVFDTYGSLLDTTLAAYTGTAVNNLTQEACTDGSPWGWGPSLISFASPVREWITTSRLMAGSHGRATYVLNWHGLTNISPPTVLDTNQVGFASTLFTVNENIPGFATIEVVYSGGAPGAVSVDYQTADGSAIDGIDYFGQSGSLTLQLGRNQQEFHHSDIG